MGSRQISFRVQDGYTAELKTVVKKRSTAQTPENQVNFTTNNPITNKIYVLSTSFVTRRENNLYLCILDYLF